MSIKASEKGQALILITLAAVGLFAFAALAIDGSRVYSDRRHAQNAADTAALAAALASSRGGDITTIAQSRATSNGYDDNGTSNDVTITVENSPSGVCPANTAGKDITVTIVSYVNTTFAQILGRSQVTNAGTATARSCASYTGPMFNGDAIVALSPSGLGFDARGTPDFDITGGGILANSSSAPAVTCMGAADVAAPSVRAVGTTGLGSCYSGPTPVTGITQLTYADYSGLFPREPACNGTATQSGGTWYPEAGKDGSRVAFSGDMDFASGLYCVTNSPGPYHGELSGTEMTFYIMSANFSMKFNGGGNLTASAPTSGEYKGVLLYLAPQVDANGNLLNTQALDMRGNGNGDVVGTIIAPSADVTMFGNSGTGAFNTQVIAYQVDSGGTADITVSYQANDNYEAAMPSMLTVLK